MDQQTTLGVSNTISLLVGALVASVAVYFSMRAKQGVPETTTTAASGSLPTVILDTISYTPHILLLFGLIADAVTTKFGTYSIPSLIGLISIFINWVFKYFWTGVYEIVAKFRPQGTTTQSGGDSTKFLTYDGCSVQGFGALASKFAPQTLVVTATVFSYYMFDLVANRGTGYAWPIIVMFVVFYGLQAMVMGDCPLPEGDTDQPNWVLKMLAAFVEGLFVGGTSYAVVQNNYPEYLPSSNINPFPRRSRKDLKEKDGQLIDENGVPYIVYGSNGQVFPDLSSAEARAKSAATLASGAPATPGSCGKK
jgi:hypothetical protein